MTAPHELLRVACDLLADDPELEIDQVERAEVLELLEIYRACPEPDDDRSDDDPREGDILSQCRGCGRPVIWVAITKKDGTPGKLPLDARAPVYLVDTVHAYPASRWQRANRLKGAYVSHFATCTNANDFSQAKRKKTDA